MIPFHIRRDRYIHLFGEVSPKSDRQMLKCVRPSGISPPPPEVGKITSVNPNLHIILTAHRHIEFSLWLNQKRWFNEVIIKAGASV